VLLHTLYSELYIYLFTILLDNLYWFSRRWFPIRIHAKLLNKFETIEHLLQNIPSIANMKIRGAKRIKDLIDAHQDDILMCKKLTAIECNAKVANVSFGLERSQCDHSDLHELFDELGFGTLRRERWQRIVKR